jgi:hypothetical protein
LSEPTCDLLLNFRSPCGDYLLTFDDDGKVAYAYLKNSNKEIIGDVWLYNRCPTPNPTEEWKDRSKLPFANCAGYVSDEGRMQRHPMTKDVLVEWAYKGDAPVAHVYVFKELYGIVGPKDKPGYARLAIHDGPLAKMMRRRLNSR